MGFLYAVEIMGSTISNNQSSGRGAGIDCGCNGTVAINNCVINGNSPISSGVVSGLNVADGVQLTITDSSICSNDGNGISILPWCALTTRKLPDSREYWHRFHLIKLLILSLRDH